MTYTNLVQSNIIGQMTAEPDSLLFRQPVSRRDVPDYYEIVRHPIDLLKMKEKANQRSYKSRQDFVADLRYLATNALLYNGLRSPIYTAACW